MRRALILSNIVFNRAHHEHKRGDRSFNFDVRASVTEASRVHQSYVPKITDYAYYESVADHQKTLGLHHEVPGLTSRCLVPGFDGGSCVNMIAHPPIARWLVFAVRSRAKSVDARLLKCLCRLDENSSFQETLKYSSFRLLSQRERSQADCVSCFCRRSTLRSQYVDLPQLDKVYL